ncbi:unnamed protein product [Clavelina lepadiformis]|uniref:MICOS complex subunit MIC10 n=1 Tax=Clavelina lepadiformis TaxID=159417 RepID=A0ABP0GFM0_CLALP
MSDENFYGKNVDKCLTDLAVKVGAGVAVGGVFSILFKRRVWPITMGAGIGIGMAYTTCENRFRQHYAHKIISSTSQLYRPDFAEDNASGVLVESAEPATSQSASGTDTSNSQKETNS